MTLLAAPPHKPSLSSAHQARGSNKAQSALGLSWDETSIDYKAQLKIGTGGTRWLPNNKLTIRLSQLGTDDRPGMTGMS
jgi:hypothetical protein